MNIKIISISLSIIILLCGCYAKSPNSNIGSNRTPDIVAINTPTVTPLQTPEPIDYQKIKPNEVGKVMVVMFHNFVDGFTPTRYDNGEYTTTFDAFRKLLEEIYSKGYRLVSLNDFVNNDIKISAGYVPIVFTFDDATNGQFNLVDDGGKLVANKNSAVGILEEFNKIHPDFGMNGTFFINLGSKVFDGQGTLDQRLKYLTDKGFEIGNHTYNHVSLPQVRSAEKIQQEIGQNQKEVNQLIPGYIMKTFSLPYGQASKDLQQYVEKGEFEGFAYENKAILEVGAGPTLSTVNKNSRPLSMSRVRASGITKVNADFSWWLSAISRDEEYVSDGDIKTVCVPKQRLPEVDIGKLNGKEIISY